MENETKNLPTVPEISKQGPNEPISEVWDKSKKPDKASKKLIFSIVGVFIVCSIVIKMTLFKGPSESNFQAKNENKKASDILGGTSVPKNNKLNRVPASTNQKAPSVQMVRSRTIVKKEKKPIIYKEISVENNNIFLNHPDAEVYIPEETRDEIIEYQNRYEENDYQRMPASSEGFFESYNQNNDY